MKKVIEISGCNRWIEKRDPPYISYNSHYITLRIDDYMLFNSLYIHSRIDDYFVAFR
jgi:hypothetical protein